MLKVSLKYLFGLLFMAAGINHFVNPSFYIHIMPPYIPWHAAMVAISGVAEFLLGLGLLIKKYQRVSARGLVALLVAVFPANIHMYLHPELFPEISKSALLWRLPIQFLLIAWAFVYTKRA